MIVIPKTLHISPKKKQLISFATLLGMDLTILRILFWGDAILLQLVHGKILKLHLGLKIWLAVFDYLWLQGNNTKQVTWFQFDQWIQEKIYSKHQKKHGVYPNTLGSPSRHQPLDIATGLPPTASSVSWFFATSHSLGRTGENCFRGKIYLWSLQDLLPIQNW